MRRQIPVIALAGMLLAASAASAVRYRLPEEKPAVLPPGPGAELTGAYCVSCHSLDYLQVQPRGKGAAFWRDTVAKMVNVYKAPVPPEAASTIADYLAATYGAETRATLWSPHGTDPQPAPAVRRQSPDPQG